MKTIATESTAEAYTTALVREVMTPGVIGCPPETPLRTVARMMASYRVHAVVVDHDFGWSVVSDLDLVEALGVGADTATAGRIARTPAVMVAPDETLERAAQLMSEHEVSHLVVAVPGAERPLGVLSTLDVARALAVEPGTHDAGPTS
jgi:predicted transcriptional regulator